MCRERWLERLSQFSGLGIQVSCYYVCGFYLSGLSVGFISFFALTMLSASMLFSCICEKS